MLFVLEDELAFLVLCYLQFFDNSLDGFVRSRQRLVFAIHNLDANATSLNIVHLVFYMLFQNKVTSHGDTTLACGFKSIL